MIYYGLIVLISAQISASDVWKVLGGNEIKTRGWKPEGRIVNGEEARAHSAPYAAYIKTTYVLKTEACTGSLISTRHILTAAHCVETTVEFGSPQGVLVTLGAHNVQKEEPSQQKISGTYKIHSDYDRIAGTHDIAIIRLQQEVNPVEKYIDIVKLSSSQYEKAYAGQMATVFGWGFVHSKPFLENTDVLRMVDMPVESQCAYEGCLCTIVLNGKGTCPGDSGGPLVIDGIQIGVLNGGLSKDGSDFCEDQGRNYFASVPHYFQWIQYTMRELDLNSRPPIAGF